MVVFVIFVMLCVYEYLQMSEVIVWETKSTDLIYQETKGASLIFQLKYVA